LQHQRNALAAGGRPFAAGRLVPSPAMAILAGIFGILGRFVGKLLTAALGWASTLLFGRVPQNKQIILVLITFGSIAWVAMVLGVLFPDVGTFLLAFVPAPDYLEPWVRLAMLAAAIITPLLIGMATLFIQDKASRASGLEAAKNVLRGYPLALVLAFVLAFLGVVSVVRKARSLAKRWADAHVPIVVREGGYEEMVGDLERALDDAGLEVAMRVAPAVMAVPGKMLAAIAGAGVRALVPDQLVQLVGRDIEVALYPSDIAIAGREPKVTRARAAIASRLTGTSAFLTTAAEAQAVEERLERLAKRASPGPEADAELAGIDTVLATLEIPYEEWEVLYRMRLQVERDLLAGNRPGQDFPGARPDRVPRATTDPAAGAVQVAFGMISIALVVADLVLALRERSRR
jgi:hypothetical protein